MTVRSQAWPSVRPIAWLAKAPVTDSKMVEPRSSAPRDAGRRCPPKSNGGEQDGKPGRDADDAGDPDRRADQGGDWPARVVGQRRRQHGEHAGLREDGDERAGAREREGPIEGAGRASLSAVAAQHDEREDRTAERDGLANEPGCAQPQQHERDQGTPR